MQESEISKIDWFKNHRVESHKETPIYAPTSQHSSKFPSKSKPISNSCQASRQDPLVNDNPLQRHPTFLSEIADISIYI